MLAIQIVSRMAFSFCVVYDGVMIADSVGLGKTWIGKKLLEDFAYHMRQKALVICPASLRPMWERGAGRRDHLCDDPVAGGARTRGI